MREKKLTKLSSLFDKYKQKLIAPEGTVIDAFIEVAYDLLGFRIKKEHVSYSPSQKTIAIKGQGALRSELKMHESEIINHLKGRLGEKNAPQRIV